MRHGTLIGLAAALAACGVATTVTNDAADAQQRRGRPQPKQRPNAVRVPNFDYPGGMAGCFDPNLSGYPRAAAERAGGVPCATPRRAATNSPAARGTTWIVGMWVMQDGYCASGDSISFESGGRYATNELDAIGGWSLSGDRLTIVYREADEETGAPVGPQRRMAYRLVRVNANEMRLDADRYRRCSGNAEPWHPGRR